MNGMIRYLDQDLTEIEEDKVLSEVFVIPLRNAVILPGILLPVFIGRRESIQLIKEEAKPGELVGLFTQYSPQDEEISEDKLYSTGCLAEIHHIVYINGGGYQVFLQGIQKIKLEKIIQKKPYMKAKISPLVEIKDVSKKTHKEFQERVIQYLKNHTEVPNEISGFIRKLDNPSSLANQITFFSEKSVEEKIKYLEISHISEKIKLLDEELITEINRIHIEKDMEQKIEDDVFRFQKESYLRKQMDIIRKELGEENEEVDDIEKQFEQKYLPKYMREVVNKELKRMRSMENGSYSKNLEASQLYNWFQLILALPWELSEKKDIPLLQAGEILDKDHEGLEDVKKRILEFIAVEKQVGTRKAPILCFVGPPGVGKTSLAKSISRSIGRPLVRVSLGGVHDEAEIRGHRRTYVGALPGKILNAMKKAKTMDPVFLLDEIDKIGSSYNRDPSSALLEVLDPEQNHTFEDHYLGEPYDLSHVLFICTANSFDSIPLALLDRMEVIKLSGYTFCEKKDIAKKHLLPFLIKELNLEKNQFSISDSALGKIITSHTREAGVRDLKRKLESLARKALRSLLEEEEKRKEDENQNPIKMNQFPKMFYDIENIEEVLGRDVYFQHHKENLGIAGVATGLAWTPTGGEILFIEAISYKGKGELKLSGQLGDIMKESAQTALSFLRAHCHYSELRVPADFFTNRDIHIHIPSGAIPKEGPSAGVAILVALASLFTNQAVRNNIAMTGEISLRGKVLPVGGIKEKIVAARNADIDTVFLPRKNQAEFEEIPEYVREGINIQYYDDMLKLVKDAVPGVIGKVKLAPEFELLPLRTDYK